MLNRVDYQIRISIHALARRATNPSNQLFFPSPISIHALARRATANQHTSCQWRSYFNPRSRKESDLFSFLSPIDCSDFNPRSRKESDPP